MNKFNDEDQKHLTDHEYDGIREFDYQLPRWWINLFYITILFAAGYYVWCHVLDGSSINKEYRAEQRQLELLLAQGAAKAGNVSEGDLAAYVSNSEKLKIGAQVYQLRCLVCHGDKGQGLIGPNLTDEYWIHGGHLVQIAQSVTNGVADKGMPPWGPVLSTDQIYSVVGFIRSLRGTNPPGAKPAQGELFKE